MSGLVDKLVSLLGRRAETPAPSPAARVSIEQGELVGFVAKSGARVWRGVPYAASTGGDNRWRAPQPPPRWSGQRRALSFAPRCAQLSTLMDLAQGIRPGRVIGSEDCLALDIYAPASCAGAPVMVWIHGGFNVWGTSSTYDGSRLAANQNVIVVAVQYRLGPLGWFAHPLLDGAANFATLDLIAALHWVRDNIEAFGGDPGNVTIFGESAGGHNLGPLLASPLARGLFHRAVVQSGAFDSVSLDRAAASASDRARELGATTTAALRAIPIDRLLSSYPKAGLVIDLPRVIDDGVVLPESGLRGAFDSTETFNPVPTILGSCRDEAKLFFAMNPRFTRRRLGVLVTARDQRLYDAMSEYISRVWRIRGVDQPAAAMAGAGHSDVWTYRVDWDDGGKIGPTDLSRVLGAAHALEIPFLFNRFTQFGIADRVMFTRATRAERERLSQAMGAYWASFARDGVPTCESAPGWPRRGDGAALLRLDAASDGGIEVVRESDSIDALAQDLARDPRLTAAERRSIVDEMGNWLFCRPVRGQVAAAI